jgi:phosphatidylinositol alpha-mannosyltransferase
MKQPKSRLSIGFLYDDTLDSSAGVAQYVKTLGSWLDGRGHKVSYLTGETKLHRWGGGNVYSLSKNLSLSWGGNRLSIPLIPHRDRINEVVRNHKFDVLHVQVPYSPLMSQRVINRANSDTAVVGTAHIFTSSPLSKTGSKLLKHIYGRSLRRFDRMLCVSSAAQKYAKETLGLNAEISPNVVNLSNFKRPTKPRSSGPKSIVFLGRLVERKGCEYLLRAFVTVQRDFPDARLVIAGDGPERKKLEKLAGSLGIQPWVEFLGYVNEEQKIGLLSNADIACFPSLYGESFGIVLIEAMAAGAKIVLGGDNQGYNTVLGNQKELLINPFDSEEFAARLTRLLHDERLIENLHKWQLSEVQKYDVASVGPMVEDIYRRAIAKRVKSRHN